VTDKTKTSNKTKLTKADFATKQEVRWCPGCGDYSILASVKKVLPELNIPKENVVFISGIGCAGRFPYYVDCYGFHTIHGRGPAVATGLKLTRPELSVWLVTGDGDGLSIGGNHLIHILRRNLDINILLFNNRIYGLTKGQYSPTSEQGKVTSTTPLGSIDHPLDPIAIALGAGATFVARVLDIDAKGLQTVLKSATEHKGTSFIEIYQNCNIFNDGAFSHVSDRAERQDNSIWLEHGKPLVFGKESDKSICMKEQHLAVIHSSKEEEKNKQLIHDETDINMAQSLSRMTYPDFPVPMGIFRRVIRETYEDKLNKRIVSQTKSVDDNSLKSLLNSGHIWKVE